MMFAIMSPQKCRRRCINSVIHKTLVLYLILASLSHINHALVTVGFGFTGHPKTHQTRLQMGNEFDEDDPFPNRSPNARIRQSRKPRARMKKSTSSAYSTLLPPPVIGKGSNRRRWADDKDKPSNEGDNASRKTAPLVSTETLDDLIKKTQKQGARFNKQHSKQVRKSEPSTANNEKSYLRPPSAKVAGDQPADLPEWGVIFSNDYPPSKHDILPGLKPSHFPTPTIEGVLPVSELFYRSTQSISSTQNEDDDREDGRATRARKRRRAKSYKNAESDGELGDDEELPFSAEQSDRLSTPGNKIQIRRNEAPGSSMLLDEIASGIGMGLDGNKVPSEAVRRELRSMARQEQAEQRQFDRRLKQQRQKRVENTARFSYQTSAEDTKPPDAAAKPVKPRKRKMKEPKSDRAPGRKMVRRGMEMLVGGEPINADPPQRAIELNYFNKHPSLWNRAITLNSPDFGPFLHMHAAGKISKIEVGLYCENFVHSAQKWNILSEDLKTMVTKNELRIRNENAADEHLTAVEDEGGVTDEDIKVAIQQIATEEAELKAGIVHDDSGKTILFNPRELEPAKGFGAAPMKNSKKKRESRGGSSGIASDKPLRSFPSKGGNIKKDLDIEDVPDDSKLMFTLGGELKFSLGVTKAELESGHQRGKAFRRVLRAGISLSINADQMGFDVEIAKLVIADSDGGTTDVLVQFSLEPREPMEVGEAERAAKEVNGALASAMDDGKMAMALAQMASEENGWSAKVRSRVVEEFLFETEDDEEDKEFEADDDEAEEFGPELTAEENDQDELYDGPFGMAGDPTYEKDDLWLGGGNGGVFFDYSESNIMNSPYKGTLGPYLLDAAAQRAKQNQPRVIAIGDVHGCIDELQALLRKCDYHPGDTVVFLGDLVCKGPDSLSVVQMAREIGAIGVRGNHDFEVVRWHQAIKSGADPPVIGSEHYYVASALSTADLKWMYSLPWFINSSQLNALFVHAGFVSGIRLAKQNPRLMMNMRSILPDGTVTSKFFNNWPWARLWDGPQTVFFGHDADRGLQQWENAIGLDTGCVYGGKLTACILPERKLVSVNAKREYFQYRRKHFD